LKHKAIAVTITLTALQIAESGSLTHQVSLLDVILISKEVASPEPGSFVVLLSRFFQCHLLKKYQCPDTLLLDSVNLFGDP